MAIVYVHTLLNLVKTCPHNDILVYRKVLGPLSISEWSSFTADVFMFPHSHSVVRVCTNSCIRARSNKFRYVLSPCVHVPFGLACEYTQQKHACYNRYLKSDCSFIREI